MGAPVKHSTQSALVSANWRGCEDAPGRSDDGLPGPADGRVRPSRAPSRHAASFRQNSVEVASFRIEPLRHSDIYLFLLAHKLLGEPWAPDLALTAISNPLRIRTGRDSANARTKRFSAGCKVVQTMKREDYGG